MSFTNSARRIDLNWSANLSLFDRDAKWNTHLARIEFCKITNPPLRFLQLDGKRKISWMSILDVACPICQASINIDCY